ncbi:MAG TPA: 3-isopropylmalate dehydrogenase [Candidatus Dormibacteraeota bacterium]|nr:3-isopropylmalate dehydrogenase [Candidatus Dormibacteraeota bacterium]
MSAEILVLEGDGISDEIMAPTIQVLHAVTGDLEYHYLPFGGRSIDLYNNPLTPYALESCRRASAILLAAVGGPKWDSTDPSATTPEQGLLALRKGLDLFANLRPAKPFPALYDASPIKQERLEGTDLLVVRELTGGIYFGKRGIDPDTGETFQTCAYSPEEVERIAHVAFKAARRSVTSVDKANVLEPSKLWRSVVSDVHAKSYPSMPLEHLLIDNATQQLGFVPSDFDVILADNLFGDILSDETAMISGSIGMLPSASLGDESTPGLFEPVHGSAPDIAGQGKANPLAMFLSAAMMLRHGLGRPDEATAIETAVEQALNDGLRTADLGGSDSTADATKAVLKKIK